MSEIIAERHGAVGRLIISNQAKHNAMTKAMWQALPARMAELDQDPEVRVIVIQGKGNTAFVSGADIGQFEAERTDLVAQQEYDRIAEAAYLAPVRATKPVIAAIRGYCIGGGLGLAAACDLRICTSDSRFRMPAAKLGVGYSVTGVKRFVSLLGVQNTYDIVLTGRMFDATEAWRMGFVTRTVAPCEFDLVLGLLTKSIAENAPLSIKALKLSINAHLENDDDLLERANAAVAECARSLDYVEGTRAFGEKRPPIFRGS